MMGGYGQQPMMVQQRRQGMGAGGAVSYPIEIGATLLGLTCLGRSRCRWWFDGRYDVG